MRLRLRYHDYLEPTRSEKVTDVPEDGYPEEYEDLDCASCEQPIGLCWIGGNPNGTDATEFFPFWKDYHDLGSLWEDFYTDGRFYVLCEECHDRLTAPLPPIPDRIVLPPEDWQPTVGGWIIVHTRMTDRVYFGPFATLKEADQWMRDVGSRRGVAGTLIPLVSPASNPANLWQEPIRDYQIEIASPETVDTDAR